MLSFPKPKKWHSKRYRQFVSNHPSILSGMMNHNAPHHYRKGTGGGGSLKPSDLYCIPLSVDEHIPLVHSGKVVLDEVTVLRECLRLMEEYLVEHNVK